MFKLILSKARLQQAAGRRVLALNKQLEEFLAKNPDFKGTVPRRWHVSFAKGMGGAQDVLLRWDNGEMHIVFSYKTSHFLHHSRSKQLFTVIVWMMLAGPRAEFITFNLSDGEAPSTARFAFSTNRPDTVGLPDQYFFHRKGFPDAKTIGAEAPPWADRSDDIIWRGAAVGTGVFNPDPVLASHPGVIQRIRFAHLAKGSDIDAGFVPITMTEPIWPLIERYQLSGDYIDETTWAKRKFAIDIDGITNTWSNLMVRLAYGCCVLKVESQYGYRQWYYDRLHAWQHYVPVKADMSDLFERVAWARDHPREAAAIAANGHALAQTLTYENESRNAAACIMENWDGRDFG